ncbi:hypothetical protein ACJJVG_05855 [Pseudocitrobacter faecalis]|uniref:hypothetical protein n=1 Tax=Pseudocitrobacter faecalis TaxID=1398493 RepID=UPI00389A966D
MDESRKQFEESFRKIMASGDLRMPEDFIKICWEVWQGSRAAIEIKLDDKVMVEDEFDKGHNCAIDYCAEAIRAAGIKVRE